MCDCLERATKGGREYYLGRWCIRTEDSIENTEDCLDVRGRNPIVQNIVKGARYCGKRGGVAFKDAIRPQYQQSKFKCPSGYSPCFNEQLDDANS